MPPAPSGLQHRPQYRTIFSIERGKPVAELLQALHLIFEWRQRIVQALHIHLQPLKAFGKSLSIGDQERQIEFAGNSQ